MRASLARAGRLAADPGPALAVLLAVAALPRAGLLFRAPAFITNDSLSYLLPGFDLVNGLGFEPIFKRPPAYPAFVGAALWFFGPQNLDGLLLAQHLLGLITVGLTYLLGRALWGPAAGGLAGLLAAWSGPAIVSEHYLMSETLFGTLLTAALLALIWSLGGRSLGGLATAAGLLGLAALTRPVAQLLLPGVVGLALFAWPTWRGRLRAALLAVACYAVVVLPWMARNGVVQRSFTLAGGLGEGLAVRTIRLDQEFDFRDPGGNDRLRVERRIFREEARQGSAFELARRLRAEAGLTPAEADRAMCDIALGAIQQRPIYYLTGSWEMFLKMFAGRSVRLRQDWQPWRGIVWEERVAHLLPAATPAQEGQFAAAQALVSLYDPARWSVAVAALFLLGVAAAAWSPRRTTALVPPIAALALLFVSAYLVGIEWRYRYPLDPLIDVTLAGGLAGPLQWAITARRAGRARREGEPSPALG